MSPTPLYTEGGRFKNNLKIIHRIFAINKTFIVYLRYKINQYGYQ